MTGNSSGFGPALRQRRTAAGVTLAEFSELIHYSVSYISRIENGHRLPTMDFAKAADDALNANGELFSQAASAPVFHNTEQRPTQANTSFNNFLREQRIKRGWSLRSLANRAGLSASTLANLERRPTPPSSLMMIVENLDRALRADGELIRLYEEALEKRFSATAASSDDVSEVRTTDFEEFFKNNFDSLRDYVARTSNLDMQNAASIASDAMLAVYEQWKDIESPQAFAYTVAKRRLADFQRSADRKNEVSTEDTDDWAKPAPSAESEALPGEGINDLIYRLPPQQRAIMTRLGKGHSPTEIASELGLSAGTVHSHMTKARRQLQVEVERRKLGESRDIADTDGETQALLNLGRLLEKEGETAEAISAYLSAEKIAYSLSKKAYYQEALSAQVKLFIKINDLSTAAHIGERLVNSYWQTGDYSRSAGAREQLAEIQISMGAFSRALSELKNAARDASKIDDSSRTRGRHLANIGLMASRVLRHPGNHVEVTAAATRLIEDTLEQLLNEHIEEHGPFLQDLVKSLLREESVDHDFLGTLAQRLEHIAHMDPRRRVRAEYLVLTGEIMLRNREQRAALNSFDMALEAVRSGEDLEQIGRVHQLISDALLRRNN